MKALLRPWSLVGAIFICCAPPAQPTPQTIALAPNPAENAGEAVDIYTGVYSTQPPAWFSSVPVTGGLIRESMGSVLLAFSEPLLAASAQAGIEVSTDSVVLAGETSVFGSAVVWTPLTPWKPNTRYLMRISAKVLDADSIALLNPTDLEFFLDSTAPAAPQGFTAVPGGAGIALNFSLPADEDLARVRIIRNEVSAPTDASDGTVIFDGLATSVLDRTALLSANYYYAAYATDLAGNTSSLVFAEAATSFVFRVGVTAPTSTVDAGKLIIELYPDDTRAFEQALVSKTVDVALRDPFTTTVDVAIPFGRYKVVVFRDNGDGILGSEFASPVFGLTTNATCAQGICPASTTLTRTVPTPQIRELRTVNEPMREQGNGICGGYRLEIVTRMTGTVVPMRIFAHQRSVPSRLREQFDDGGCDAEEVAFLNGVANTRGSDDDKAVDGIWVTGFPSPTADFAGDYIVTAIYEVGTDIFIRRALKNLPEVVRLDAPDISLLAAPNMPYTLLNQGAAPVIIPAASNTNLQIKWSTVANADYYGVSKQTPTDFAAMGASNDWSGVGDFDIDVEPFFVEFLQLDDAGGLLNQPFVIAVEARKGLPFGSTPSRAHAIGRGWPIGLILSDANKGTPSSEWVTFQFDIPAPVVPCTAGRQIVGYDVFASSCSGAPGDCNANENRWDSETLEMVQTSAFFGGTSVGTSTMVVKRADVGQQGSLRVIPRVLVSGQREELATTQSYQDFASTRRFPSPTNVAGTLALGSILVRCQAP